MTEHILELSDCLGFNPGDERKKKNLGLIGKLHLYLADESGEFSSNGSKEKGQVKKAVYRIRLMNGEERIYEATYKEWRGVLKMADRIMPNGKGEYVPVPDDQIPENGNTTENGHPPLNGYSANGREESP